MQSMHNGSLKRCPHSANNGMEQTPGNKQGRPSGLIMVRAANLNICKQHERVF
ncbi:hypothetical protein EJ73_00703 [Hoylesella shahii DSM 15611 = JCM 12083]|uniref:Uncharacterized protein n=1 Tax=Hoylesella shahii DSM 15611 = JCM 12083 TaxID=1122991 RepID=A0A318HXW0_9BACT|nr:hypothetical protein EJ73_00703 [Hoylesella shahii DSM 15611 = JCM 12083]